MAEARWRPRRRVAEVVRAGREAPRASTDGGRRTGERAGRAMMQEIWEGAAASMSPGEVDGAWKRLLEETLPPEKQESLMEAYMKEKDPKMRYNMLLEFSSYLRQGAAPGQGSGLSPGTPRVMGGYDEEDGDLCWEVVRVLLIVGTVLVAVLGAVYFVSEGNLSMESDDE
ncbi:hypothetical protein AB1Y20_012922 [Prymnesium parvum]|uniref:Uncharacterized protein n=1 Tax=Prymnesium parvum TaxID=97485 RepID=A0AB34IJ79_PRYPA